jgi:hypothetical protein
MIDDTNRLVFVESPKTGSLAIKVALRGPDHQNAAGVRPESCNHANARMLRARHPAEWRSYLTFVCVRNTWDRARSFFEYHRDRAAAASYAATTFDDWVAAGCPPPDEPHLRDFFWKTGRFDDTLDQLRYVDGVDEIIVLHASDFGTRAREVQAGLDRVCARAGLTPPQIPHDRNNFGRSHEPVTWSRETIERLADRYREEIRIFGFEPPLLSDAGAERRRCLGKFAGAETP